MVEGVEVGTAGFLNFLTSVRIAQWLHSFYYLSHIIYCRRLHAVPFEEGLCSQVAVHRYVSSGSQQRQKIL